MIFVVYYEESDSGSGIAITGIFDNRNDAVNWARSEGSDYKVQDIPFGPIDWNKLAPLPDIDWFGNEGTKL